jgi:hypothetical protein
MSFKRINEITNLLRTIQHLPEELRNNILSDARILPGEYESLQWEAIEHLEQAKIPSRLGDIIREISRPKKTF